MENMLRENGSVFTTTTAKKQSGSITNIIGICRKVRLRPFHLAIILFKFALGMSALFRWAKRKNFG